MLAPRWRKVLRELWSNRSRTLLAALAIAVGVFAIGATAGASVAIERDMASAYAAVNPPSATLLSEPFDEEMLQAVEGMPGVVEADGRRSVNVRLQIGPDEWYDLQLFAMPDYADQRIGIVRPERGAWPPPEQAMLMERASLSYLGLEIGQTMQLRTPNGVERELPIAGTVHDLTQVPAVFDGTVYAYIDLDTLEWLGEPRNMNQLRILTAPEYDQDAIQIIAGEVEDRLKRSGRDVYMVYVPEPGKHPQAFLIEMIVLVLGVLAAIAVALSCFLVITTITALLAQQRRQIGVMKAIGARSGQILGMYLATVLVFGLLALLPALPLSSMGAQLLSDFMTGLLNFDPAPVNVPPAIRGLQIAVALLAPLLAAGPAVLASARRTVRENLDDTSTEPARAPGTGGALRRVLGMVPRPVLLSLRNTFRRRGRLLLTLSTLTMAGTIFIGVLNLRASLLATVDTMLNFNQYDVWVTLVEPQRMQKIEQVAAGNPSVVDAEGWAFIQSRRIYAEGGEGSMVFGFFLPPDSSMVEPAMLQGRWLQAEDERAIVVSSALMRDEPDLQLGSELIIKIEGKEERWTIVGVIQSLGPFAYAPYDTYAEITGETGRAAIAMVQLHAGNAAERAAQIPLLEQGFESSGMRVSSIISLDQERAEVEAAFNVLTGLLMVMAGLLAVVGGLGLTSTMSLNVLERTREIGVMRAIGANSGAVFQVVVAEGLCIGLISWLLAALLALAVNAPLSAAFGIAFINAPLSAALAPLGTVIWLAAILALAVVASILPAWRATRLTIRAVLAYE